MKTLFSIFSFLFFLFSTQAQQVQWANKLIKYSSDLGGKQFGIKRILGKPDAFPQAGMSPNAWMPKNALDGYEFVVVSFENPQTVKQVAVFENLNAGCVVKISVDTGSGKFQNVWHRKMNYKTPTFKATIPADHSYYFKRKRRKIQEAPEVLNPGIENAILETAVSGVVAVRVEFNFALLPGQKQIDAIGISDSEIPLTSNINSTAVFEQLSNSKSVELENVIPINPTVSVDGKKLFVTNIKQDNDEICSFEKKGNSWINKKVETQFNTNPNYNYVEHLGTDFILKGGNQYSRGSNECGYELFSNSTGNASLGIIKISAFNNYEDTSDATITNDGKIFVMGIETDFTQGGTDLYFAQKKDDGTFGFLQSMGKVINSAADEGMMQLLSDQKTLFFSSNGFSGFGDFDIYVSYRLDETWKNWSEPVNLGSKINTIGFDGMPFYDETNEMLYYIAQINSTNVLKEISLPKNTITKLN
jgi:hypothetical protein